MLTLQEIEEKTNLMDEMEMETRVMLVRTEELAAKIKQLENKRAGDRSAAKRVTAATTPAITRQKTPRSVQG
jgi:hypothetical protein